MDCIIYAAKTKALISYAVTAKLICVFVFAYAERWFSHDTAQIVYCHKIILTQRHYLPVPLGFIDGYLYITVVLKHILQHCLAN